MSQQPRPEPAAPEDEPPPHPAEPLQINTPVINTQDLELEAAIDALEKLEKQVRRQPPT